MNKYTFIILVLLMQFAMGNEEFLVPSFAVGNPMYEIESDLMNEKALTVASPLSYTDKLQKGETYLLPTKKILYIESSAGQYGDGYKVKRMAIFNAGDINKINKKNLVFFTAFDLKKQVGFNP